MDRATWVHALWLAYLDAVRDRNKYDAALYFTAWQKAVSRG